MEHKCRIRLKDSIYDQVTTEEGCDVTKQSLRYGLSRTQFLIVGIYGMLTLSRFMWGFAPFYHMLVRSGAFVWLCDGVEGPLIIDGVEQPYLCIEQNESINYIYNIINASVLMSSAFAGCFNSFLGAKLTAVMGSFLMFCGMILIAFSCETFNYYNIGAILLGLGMDPIIYSSLNAVILYPGSELFITSVLSASTSIGMFIPVLMQLLFDHFGITFTTLMLIYAILCPGVCLILYLLYYPTMRFYKQEEINEALDITYKKSSLEFDKIDSDIKLIEEGNNKPHNNNLSSLELFLSKYNIPTSKLKLILTSVLSYHFLLLTSVFIIVVMISIYTMSSVSQLFTDNQRTLLGILMPLTFIPCIVFSPFLDKMGSMFTLWYEALCSVVFLCMLLINHIVTKYIAIVWFSLFFTYFGGQVIMFSVETFDPSIHTIIIGLVSFVGGLSAIITPTIYKSITEANDSKMISALPLFVSFGFIQTILVASLEFAKRRKYKITL